MAFLCGEKWAGELVRQWDGYLLSVYRWPP